MSPSSQIPDVDISAAWEYASEHGFGFIYAVGFDSAEGPVVKVGQTIEPEKRLKSHKRMGRSFGLALTDLWLSKPHLNINTTERTLIAFCKERWQPVYGREWFDQADFDAVRVFADQLPMKPYSERHRKAHATHFLMQRNYPVETAAAAVGLTLEEVEAA